MGLDCFARDYYGAYPSEEPCRPLLLYRFRYLDPARNKWLLARYACERDEIAKRYAQYELIEPPEVRHVPDDPDAMSVAHLARPR